MWRAVRLSANLILSSLLFTYFILILILLLNSRVTLESGDFFMLFLNLFVFYGPLWFVALGVVFFIIQFFSEKKLAIGILNPPTIVYFLSFTILVISFVLYFNYDYFRDFFSDTVRGRFIEILLLNILLIITAILFSFFKKFNKIWIQVIFLGILSVNVIHSYSSVIQIKQYFKPPVGNYYFPQETTPRKIRIVVMNGLSLKLILSLSSEQKLRNFNLILRNGVRGNIQGFQPNHNLALLNSTLTGREPSQLAYHNNHRFRFISLNQEFDVFPRYVFFKSSASFNFTYFYERMYENVENHIRQFYEGSGFSTIDLLQPTPIEAYSPKHLAKNTQFTHFFPGMLEKNDPKSEMLKKTFYYDDYFQSINTDLKDTDNYLSIIRLPGLSNIVKYFYHYHIPQIFGDIPSHAIKTYGSVVEHYYQYYDTYLGRVMSAMGDREILVVVSFFEYEPMPIWRRILGNLFGMKDIYVYKSLDSLGTIFLYEKNALKKDYPLKDVSVLDIFPTLIYYTGFQLSQNLPGGVIREIFTNEFILSNPIDIKTQ